MIEIMESRKELFDNNNSLFWEEGFLYGLRCKRHPDQVVQEEWMKRGMGKMTYDQFQEWLRGYKFGRGSVIK